VTEPVPQRRDVSSVSFDSTVCDAAFYPYGRVAACSICSPGEVNASCPRVLLLWAMMARRRSTTLCMPHGVVSLSITSPHQEASRSLASRTRVGGGDNCGLRS
jgi:hypothetical protein